MDAEQIARIAHDINRAYCMALSDLSQKPWDECEEWQRQSVFAGVRFHISNPDAGPEASHDCWLETKQKDGWVYGSIKDPKNKRHPCMMAFHDLPVEQQVKDWLFRQVVHSTM